MGPKTTSVNPMLPIPDQGTVTEAEEVKDPEAVEVEEVTEVTETVVTPEVEEDAVEVDEEDDATLDALSERILGELSTTKEELVSSRKSYSDLEAKHKALIKRFETIIFKEGAVIKDTTKPATEINPSAATPVNLPDAEDFRGQYF